MALPAWQSRDLRTLQRERWLRLARAEAAAATDAGEDHVATAFRIVAAPLGTGALPGPSHKGPAGDRRSGKYSGRAIVQPAGRTSRAAFQASSSASLSAMSAIVGRFPG